MYIPFDENGIAHRCIELEDARRYGLTVSTANNNCVIRLSSGENSQALVDYKLDASNVRDERQWDAETPRYIQ